jgi:anti-sigma B factor antagonist
LAGRRRAAARAVRHGNDSGSRSAGLRNRTERSHRQGAPGVGGLLALTAESRRIGDIVVLKCTGRIVDGEESAALHEHVARLLPQEPHVILHLAGVEFVDSGGLGTLVRLRSKAQNAGGDVRLCEVPPRIAEVLRVTKLQTVFESHPSESEAVAAFYSRAKEVKTPERLATDILCVAPSLDLIAYLREVLRQAGHGVMTSDNLPDALILLRATRPKVVVISASLRWQNSAMAEAFRDVAARLPVIELPSDFSHRDAGLAGRRLLEQVRDVFAQS